MSASVWEKLDDLRWEAFHWRKAAGMPLMLGLCMLGAAFIGIAAQIKIYLPWTPVPITGQTFAVLLLGVLLGASGGALSSAFYVLLGAAGVPWFAGAGAAGVAALMGPTGGYLLGFVAAAFFTGYFCDRYSWARQLPGLILVMLTANFVLIHGTGLLWLSKVTGAAGWKELLTIGTLPFISGDLIKVAAASALSRVLLPRRSF